MTQEDLSKLANLFFYARMQAIAVPTAHAESEVNHNTAARYMTPRPLPLRPPPSR